MKENHTKGDQKANGSSPDRQIVTRFFTLANLETSYGLPV